MNRSLIFAVLSLALNSPADTIRLTTGKNVIGQVTGYANMSFAVADEKGKVSQLPASTVVSIDFVQGAVETVIEMRNAGTVKRKISLFDKGAFSAEDSKGAVQRIPAVLVSSISFAGASGKDIQIVGGTDLAKQLVSGKVTIVDFYADWCGPCRMIGPVLEEIAKKDPDVALRKVNVDSNQPLARKCKVNGIPHIMIFDKNGKNTATIVGADKDGVLRAVAQAKAGAS